VPYPTVLNLNNFHICEVCFLFIHCLCCLWCQDCTCCALFACQQFTKRVSVFLAQPWCCLHASKTFLRQTFRLDLVASTPPAENKSLVFLQNFSWRLQVSTKPCCIASGFSSVSEASSAKYCLVATWSRKHPSFESRMLSILLYARPKTCAGSPANIQKGYGTLHQLHPNH